MMDGEFGDERIRMGDLVEGEDAGEWEFCIGISRSKQIFCVHDTGQDRVQKVFFEGLHALKLLLVQQYLAAVSAGEEDGQRLLFLSCWYNRIIWRQSDVWERLYDPDNGARGFHQCKILWERVRLAGLPTWTIY